MAEEPEEMLPQQRRATSVPGKLAVDGADRQKETRTNVAVHEQENARRKEDAEGKQTEDCGDEPRPAGQGHAHHAHAPGAHVERSSNEVKSAHKRGDAEECDTNDPEVRAQPLARSS